MKSNSIMFLGNWSPDPSLQETHLLPPEFPSFEHLRTFPDVKHGDLGYRRNWPLPVLLPRYMIPPKSAHSLSSCLHLTLQHSLPVFLQLCLLPFCPQPSLPWIIATFPQRGGYSTITQGLWGKCKIGSLSSRNVKHDEERNQSIESMHIQSQSQELCCWNSQTDSAIYIRMQTLQIVKKFLKEKNKVLGLILPDFKTSCEVRMIKTSQCCCTGGRTGSTEQNRIQK